MFSPCLWPLLFLMTSQLLILLGFPYKRHFVFLLLLSWFSLCVLAFSIFTMMCFFVDLVSFIILDIHCTSWMYALVFHQIWKYSAFISLNFFFPVPFFLVSLLGLLLLASLCTLWGPVFLWSSFHFPFSPPLFFELQITMVAIQT